jgi:hypothetical protein
VRRRSSFLGLRTVVQGSIGQGNSRLRPPPDHQTTEPSQNVILNGCQAKTVVGLPWAADRCPSLRKLRTVLPSSDVNRDGAVQLVLTHRRARCPGCVPRRRWLTLPACLRRRLRQQRQRCSHGQRRAAGLGLGWLTLPACLRRRLRQQRQRCSHGQRRAAGLGLGWLTLPACLRRRLRQQRQRCSHGQRRAAGLGLGWLTLPACLRRRLRQQRQRCSHGQRRAAVDEQRGRRREGRRGQLRAQ